MFLWIMPMPPSRESAIAIWDSVTVSMAALATGMLSVISRVIRVCVLVSEGMTELRAGLQQDVIKCKAFWDSFWNHR